MHAAAMSADLTVLDIAPRGAILRLRISTAPPEFCGCAAAMPSQ
jgi:hypothetical protein